MYYLREQYLGFTEVKARKLTDKYRFVLRKAEQHGVVPGGLDASERVVYKMKDLGLLTYKTPVYVPTDKGLQALKDGKYEV